jgi:hypothetical protein
LAWTLTVNAQPAAVKLWPQITGGIHNHADTLVMNCEVAADGLTVTDTAWDTYAVAGCGKRWTLNMGLPRKEPLQLYAFLQKWEQGKLARPDTPNILSTWIQVEFVDNYPLSQYRFTDAKGRVRNENLKHQAPASATYALSLFGHCVMDGQQCWEIGARYSEDLNDYSDWRVREPTVGQPPASRPASRP